MRIIRTIVATLVVVFSGVVTCTEGATYTLSSTSLSYSHTVSWSNAGGVANSYSFMVPAGQTAHVTFVHDISDYAGYHEDKTQNQFYIYFNGARQNWTSINNGIHYFERDVTVSDTMQISCFTGAYFERKTWIEYINGKAVPRFQDVYYTDYQCAYGYKISISYGGSGGGGGGGSSGGGDDNPATWSFSSTTGSIPAGGGKGSLTITCAQSVWSPTWDGYFSNRFSLGSPYDCKIYWEGSSDNGFSVNWVDVSDNKSKVNFYYSADANTSTSAKQWTVTIEYRGLKKVLSISQPGSSTSAPVTYTLKLHRNNSASDGATAGRNLTVGKSRALPTVSELGWTRSGYTFVGWAKSSTATSAVYSNGQSVKDLSSTKGATIHLYAVWKKNAPATYILRLHRNNSKNDGATAGRTMTVDASRNLPTISSLGWTRSGYTFVGWAANQSAISATYTNGQSVKNLSTTKDTTVHLYAVWKKNAPVTYTLRLYRNNSKNDGATAGRTMTVDASRNLPTISSLGWTRSGYTFVGWSYTSTATVANYTDGESVKNLSTTKGIVVNLYAIWKSNVQTYKIYLCRNNSANDGAMAIRTIAIGQSRKLPTITELGWTRNGYRFSGWDGYSESAGNMVRYSDGQTVFNVTTTPNSIIYFYAVWR